MKTGDLHSWKERRDAEEAVRAYLSDFPSMIFVFSKLFAMLTHLQLDTVAFVHGPQGSGKSSMLSAILKENERYDVG